MQQLEKYKWQLLTIVYFVITWFFYKNTVHAKFIFDWNTWVGHYIREGWGGLSGCYGDKSMRWGYHLLNMLQWKIFGLNASGWFWFAIILHVSSAVLLALITHRILSITSIKDRFPVAATAGLLWLVSPYHSETVVWGATTLFLAMTLQVLAGLYLFICYTETQQTKFLWLVFLCYFSAMFTFEAFVPFPILLFVLWLTTYNTSINKLSLRSFLQLIFLPMAVSIVLYFLANKWRIGSWVGHYGEASHLNTDLYLIIPNFSKYLLKLLLVPLYFSFKQRDALYAVLENKKYVWLQGAAYLLFFAALAWVYFKSNKTWKVVIGWFALFCVALVPVINLYFMYYKDIEQDRYVYFASAFFYVALTVLFFAVAKRWALLPLAVCLFISFQFLQRNTYRWSESGRIAKSLLNDFRWQNANRVFVLLTPDTYDGAYCMRSMPESSLAEMLFVQRGIDITPKIQEVYQWNVMSATDSATCEVKDSATLEIKLVGKGGWLWRNSFGAGGFHTDALKAETNQWYPWFTVQFTNKQPGDVYIYASGDHWKQVENF